MKKKKCKSCKTCKNDFANGGDCVFCMRLIELLDDFGEWGTSMLDALLCTTAENCKPVEDFLFYEVAE
jgi:hypothetical protein